MKESMKGQSLIELMLVIGLAAVLLPALLTGFVAARGGRPQLEQRLQAIALAQQGLEAARVFRENDWEAFSAMSSDTCTTLYHPQQQSNTWILTTGTDTPAAGFTRKIQVCNVYRDFTITTMPIVALGAPNATIDPSTILVKTSVSWNTPIPSTVNATEYLTRVANASYTETTESDFSGGTAPSSVKVTNTSGGEIILGPGSILGDWCNPQNSNVAYNLTRNGTPISITAATGASNDQAFVTTGNNSSGYAIDKLSITQASPSAVTEPNFIGAPKAYGVYTDGTYVYFTQANPGKTVQIAQASDLTLLGTFNVSGGSSTSNSVYVQGNTGYVVVNSTLYTFDVSSKTGIRNQLGSIALSGTGMKVIVVGNYAFVATNATTKQLQIFNVTNPASMVKVSEVTMGNGKAGVDVAVDPSGNTAYFVTANGANDFFIIDTTNKTSPILSGSTYNTGSMNPKGVAYIAGGRAIIVGAGGQPYQVLKITGTTPTFCGGMTPTGVSSINAVAGLARADGSVFSYIVTDNANAEFQIITGGPGGSNLYSATGTYESKTFNAGHDVAFNYFSATTSLPSGTSITFKIAIKHGVSGSCTGVTFSSSDFVSFSPGPLSLTTIGAGYNNPGQCLRYQVVLSTSDSNQTPVLSDITFNYSL